MRWPQQCSSEHFLAQLVPRSGLLLTYLVEGGGEVGDKRRFAGAALRPQAVRVPQHGGLVKGLRRRQLAVVAAQVHVLAAHPDVRLQTDTTHLDAKNGTPCRHCSRTRN